MTSKKLLVLGVAIALAFAYAAPAQAVLINFQVDTLGNQDPTLPTSLAPTSANIGKYNAGSYTVLSGSVAATASGVSVTGAFTAQASSSGAFSTGNPGSLESFISGNLLADINPSLTSISFPGGSTAVPSGTQGSLTSTALIPSNYTATYPAKGGAAVALTPAIGGGPINTTATGSDPAAFGVGISLSYLGTKLTSGTAALRNGVLDVQQNTGVTSQALSAPVAGLQSFTVKSNIAPTIVNADFDYNLRAAGTRGTNPDGTGYGVSKVLGIITVTVPDLIGSSGLDNITAASTSTPTGNLRSVVVDASRQIYNFYLTVPTTATSTQTVTGDTAATITVTTTGQVALYALNVQVPEPATLALAGFAAIPLGFMAWRRRKRA
jgi:hypothetical protein